MQLDGQWYHLDLMQDVLNQTGLQLRYDEDMTGFYWDPAVYPACPAPEEGIPAAGETPSEETPVEPSEPSDPQEPSQPPAEEAPSDTPEQPAVPETQ